MGSVPIRAAMVVIMMGRKRMRAKLSENVLGRHARLAALFVKGEVDHHDRVFLHDADKHDHADKGIDGERQADQIKRGQARLPPPTASPTGW